MLVLTLNEMERANLYLQADDDSLRLLGSVVHCRKVGSGSRVRLGFEFAKDVKILRDEVDHIREKLAEQVKDDKPCVG